MKTFKDIDALFGAPLNTLQKPNLPHKYKNWQKVLGAVVIIAALYGVNEAIKKILKKPTKAENSEQDGAEGLRGKDSKREEE